MSQSLTSITCSYGLKILPKEVPSCFPGKSAGLNQITHSPQNNATGESQLPQHTNIGVQVDGIARLEKEAFERGAIHAFINQFSLPSILPGIFPSEFNFVPMIAGFVTMIADF